MERSNSGDVNLGQLTWPEIEACMKEMKQQIDEILKGYDHPELDRVEPVRTPFLPKHQRMKLLIAELAAVVDSLAQDSRDYEKYLIPSRTSGVWQKLYMQHKLEKEEALKKIRELERKLAEE